MLPKLYLYVCLLSVAAFAISDAAPSIRTSSIGRGRAGGVRNTRPTTLKPASHIGKVTSTSEYNSGFWKHVVTTHTHRKPPKTYIERSPDGGYYHVTEHETVHRHLHKKKLHKPNNPTHCDCKESPDPNRGICWFYSSGATSAQCKSRPCRRRYICVYYRTGLTCMMRKITSKVVPNSGSYTTTTANAGAETAETCLTVPTKSIIYVPYSAY